MTLNEAMPAKRLEQWSVKWFIVDHDYCWYQDHQSNVTNTTKDTIIT